MPHVVRPDARSAPTRVLARAPTAYDLRPGVQSAPRALVIGASTDGPQALGALLQALMAEFRSFRFLYRDQRSYGEGAVLIRTNSPQWLERTFAQIEAHLAALVDAGLLDWPRERLRDLAINATIILRYGLEHFVELGEPTGEGSGTVRRTLKRHLTLFEHRLAPQAADAIHAAIERIEADSALAA